MTERHKICHEEPTAHSLPLQHFRLLSESLNQRRICEASSECAPATGSATALWRFSSALRASGAALPPAVASGPALEPAAASVGARFAASAASPFSSAGSFFLLTRVFAATPASFSTLTFTDWEAPNCCFSRL